MKTLEESLGDFRGVVYKNFANIIKELSDNGTLVISPSLFPIEWSTEDFEPIEFHCDKIDLDPDNQPRFYQGSFYIYASQMSADDLVYLHDQLIEQYDLYNYKPEDET